MKEQKFHVGDIVVGIVTKSILQVVKVDDYGNVDVLVLEPNSKQHHIGETYYHQSSSSYTLKKDFVRTYEIF